MGENPMGTRVNNALSTSTIGLKGGDAEAAHYLDIIPPSCCSLPAAIALPPPPLAMKLIARSRQSRKRLIPKWNNTTNERYIDNEADCDTDAIKNGIFRLNS